MRDIEPGAGKGASSVKSVDKWCLLNDDQEGNDEQTVLG